METTKSITLQIRAVAGLSFEQEDSPTLFTGRLPKGSKDASKRRDLLLSQPMPLISETAAQFLAQHHGAQLAEFLSDELASYIRRVKAQRLNIGDSISLTLPGSDGELALFALTALTEGSREKKELSSSTLRELINSLEFKAATIARCEAAGISEAAFKKVVVDEFLRSSTREEVQCYAGRQPVLLKAIAHLEAIRAAVPPTAQRTLELAINRLRNAEIIADEGGI